MKSSEKVQDIPVLDGVTMLLVGLYDSVYQDYKNTTDSSKRITDNKVFVDDKTSAIYVESRFDCFSNDAGDITKDEVVDVISKLEDAKAMTHIPHPDGDRFMFMINVFKAIEFVSMHDSIEMIESVKAIVSDEYPEYIIKKAIPVVEELPIKATAQIGKAVKSIVEFLADRDVLFYGTKMSKGGAWISYSPEDFEVIVKVMLTQAGVLEKILVDSFHNKTIMKDFDRESRRVTKAATSREKLRLDNDPESLACVPTFLPTDDGVDGVESPFSSMTKFIAKEYPDIRYNSVKKELFFGKDDEFSDVITKLRLLGNNVSEKDVQHYLNSNLIPRYHPFQEYFQGLPEWDGKTDYIAMLGSHVKAKDQEFFDSMFKKHLVRSVEQAMPNDRLPNRFCLVMQSKAESLGKSTFIRNLNPMGSGYMLEHISDQMESLLSKQFMVNLEEIENCAKDMFNKIKYWISIDEHGYRQMYTQTMLAEKRTCSYWASTNELNFLGDGENSRWLIMEIEDIDFSYDDKMLGGKPKIEIDNVWSQAYALYMSGWDAQPTKEEVIKASGITKEFRYSDKTEVGHAFSEFCEPNDTHFVLSRLIGEYLNAATVTGTLKAMAVGKYCGGAMIKSKKTSEGTVYGVAARDGSPITQELIDSIRISSDNIPRRRVFVTEEELNEPIPM